MADSRFADTPFPPYNPDLYDLVYVDGTKLGGRVVQEGIDAAPEHKFESVTGAGLNGAFTSFHGFMPSSVTFSMLIINEKDWIEYRNAKVKFGPKPGPKIPPARNVVNGWLIEQGIDRIVIHKFSSPKNMGDCSYKYTVYATQWTKAPKIKEVKPVEKSFDNKLKGSPNLRPLPPVQDTGAVSDAAPWAPPSRSPIPATPPTGASDGAVSDSR